MSLATLWQSAEDQRFTKRERKVLRKTRADVAYATMKVTGERERRLAEAHGWNLHTALSQGRGAGHHQYLMNKPRYLLVLDHS